MDGLSPTVCLPFRVATVFAKRHVRFTPESGHSEVSLKCPLSARSGHQLVQSYSALMFAALTIGHHFSISAFWNAPSACGVC
jgi:hypothetical protein